MSEPTAGCRAEVAGAPESYCRNCDLLVGLDGFHVVDVEPVEGRLTVTVETASAPAGCPGCGVIAHGHGRRVHTLVDTPAFGQPVRLLWRKRTWSCPESGCPVGTFIEQDEQLARPRAPLTRRACWWAAGQLRRQRARFGCGDRPAAGHELADGAVPTAGMTEPQMDFAGTAHYGSSNARWAQRRTDGDTRHREEHDLANRCPEP